MKGAKKNNPKLASLVYLAHFLWSYALISKIYCIILFTIVIISTIFGKCSL